MQCPACNGKMAHRQIGAVEIDVCPECSGVWLDAQELDALLELSEEESLEAGLDDRAALPQTCRYCGITAKRGDQCRECERPLGMDCPRDGRAMYIVDAAGIELDRCPSCKGLWVDGFERNRLGRLHRGLDQSQTAGDQMAEVMGLMLGAQMMEEDRSAPSKEGESAPPKGPSTVDAGGKETKIRKYVEKYAGFSKICAACGDSLTRYTAWEVDGDFFCQSCATREGKVADTVVSASQFRPTAEDYWHDEQHLLEFFRWFVDAVVPWRRRRDK